MFEDQKVELLPERTTMASLVTLTNNVSIAVALNAGNVNIAGQQVNTALAAALAGAKIG
jgi:hypothetical protein